MTDQPIKLSVLIPAYNEEMRVGDTLKLFKDYLDQQDYAYEVVVVDDGSKDLTAETVRKTHPWAQVAEYSVNRGKGYATRYGAQVCKGEFILISDADGSTPIDDIEKMWPKFDAGCDIVIGSRAMVDSDVQIRQPLYRQSMGRIYNMVLRLLVLTPFKDTQCGFKAFRQSIVNPVIGRMTCDGFGADCEMLYIAAKLGYTVDEVPVRWLNSPDTRVHPIFDSLDMLREVLLIRFKALMGKYR